MEGAARVLDASAVLALLLGERGEETVRAISDGATMSTVNWSEVLQVLDADQAEGAVRTRQIETLGITLIPFSANQAELAAAFREATASAGLSLADRACLALAADRGAIAVTGDTAWSDIDVGVEVMQFR